MDESQDEHDLIFLQSLAQDVFIARCKDNAELPRRQEAVFFRDTFLKHCNSNTVRLRSQRLGQCSCAAILKGLKLHKHVHTLDLYSNLVRDAGAFSVSTIIEQLPALTHLNLGGNDIRNDGAGHLGRVLQSSNIRYLELGSAGLGDGSQALNKIDPTGAAALFRAAKHTADLSYLGLAHNRIGLDDNATASCSKMLKASTSLRHLNLAFNSLSKRAVQLLCVSVSRSPTIATLDLSGNTLCAGSAAAVAQMLPITQTLSVLKLSHNAIGATGTQLICEALMENESLVVLHLDHNHMEDLGAIAIAEMLQHNCNLTELSICSNGICRDGAVALGSMLDENKTLGILSLKGNPLHDELAMVLSSMQHEQMSITSLDLRKTKMTDQGAEWLAAGLSSCCHLERLLLSDNQITEASGLLLMAAAEDHLALHHLSVEGNQLKHTTAQKVRNQCKQNRTAARRKEPERMKRELHRLGYQEEQLNIAVVTLKRERARQKSAESEGSSSQLQCDETHAAHQEVLKEAESTRELAAMNKARIEAEIQEKMTTLDKKKHSNVSVETDFEAELAQQTQLREQAEAKLAALKGKMTAAIDSSTHSAAAIAIRDVKTKMEELKRYTARKADEYEALVKQVKMMSSGDVKGPTASRGSNGSSGKAARRESSSSNVPSVGFGSGASNAGKQPAGSSSRRQSHGSTAETRVRRQSRRGSDSSDQQNSEASRSASKLGFGQSEMK